MLKVKFNRASVIDKTSIMVVLREGKNRQIRKMLEKHAYGVKKLVRVRIGSLFLDNLAVGRWSEVSEGQILKR